VYRELLVRQGNFQGEEKMPRGSDSQLDLDLGSAFRGSRE